MQSLIQSQDLVLEALTTATWFGATRLMIYRFKEAGQVSLQSGRGGFSATNKQSPAWLQAVGVMCCLRIAARVTLIQSPCKQTSTDALLMHSGI